MGRERVLKKIAEEVLGPRVAASLWGRIEFIGDIAVIRTPLGMDPLALRPLAEEILRRFNFVKSVWAAIPGVEGPYRLRKHVWLAGEQRSETIYREHGCSFKVDINKVYISPALNYEHIRIAKLVGNGEIVVNMFAGAGLFSIIIAKHAKPSKVYSIDINPYAFEYMKENAKLNNVEDIVVPILGDAAEVIDKMLANTADRVLMPYPELALEYLPHAIKALRDKGFIHIYLHVHVDKGESWRDKSRLLAEKRLGELGIRQYNILGVRKIRNVGPRLHQTVVDAWVSKE